MEKFSKITENKNYYKELGYVDSIISSLTDMYQLWLDAEGLPQLSADEHELDDMTNEQQKFISTFIEMWDIAMKFEVVYAHPDFLIKLKARKYNL